MRSWRRRIPGRCGAGCCRPGWCWYFGLPLWLFRGRNCGYGQVMIKLADGLYHQRRGEDLLAGQLDPAGWVDAGDGRRWRPPNISSLWTRPRSARPRHPPPLLPATFSIGGRGARPEGRGGPRPGTTQPGPAAAGGSAPWGRWPRWPGWTAAAPRPSSAGNPRPGSGPAAPGPAPRRAAPGISGRPGAGGGWQRPPAPGPAAGPPAGPRPPPPRRRRPARSGPAAIPATPGG